MRMIKCDGCKLITPDDSSGEKTFEIWVNRSWSFHLCERCMRILHEDILHEVWSEDEQEWVEEE